MNRSNHLQPERRERRRKGSGLAFTLIELLTVISIIGILMAIGAGMAAAAKQKRGDAMVKAELNKLATAIEEYKGVFNVYPPDNSTNDSRYTGTRVNADPAINQLYYELVGVETIGQGASNLAFGATNWLRSDTLERLFGTGGILNSAERPDTPKRNFLPNLKPSQHKQVSYAGARFEMLVAPLEWRSKRRNPAFRLGLANDPQFKLLNPWRYVSTSPTNHPSSFDLWVEIPRSLRGGFETNLTFMNP
jgi:prepilin-type N-terminal cleavage/methylation domain-containing protein